MRLHLLGLAAVVLVLLAAAAPVRADTVTIAADEWCPYNCVPGSDKPGYMVEIAAYALGKAGHEVRYIISPWNRVLTEVVAGRVDGAIGASQDEIPEAIFPKQSLGVHKNVLAMLAERALAFEYTGVESLEGIRIGAVQGYTYQEDIDPYLASAKSPAVQLIAGTEVQSQNIRKLLAGRIDAVLANEAVIKLALADLQPRPNITLVPLGEDDDIGIGFTPVDGRGQVYADLIDAGLTELRESGQLADILAKYGLEDWQ